MLYLIRLKLFLTSDPYFKQRIPNEPPMSPFSNQFYTASLCHWPQNVQSTALVSARTPPSLGMLQTFAMLLVGVVKSPFCCRSLPTTRTLRERSVTVKDTVKAGGPPRRRLAMGCFLTIQFYLPPTLKPSPSKKRERERARKRRREHIK